MAATLTRRGSVLRGTFFTRVSLQPVGTELPSVFGLTFGGDGLTKAASVAFLVRDGQVVIERAGGAAVPFERMGAPSLRSSQLSAEPVADVLEVQVMGSQASFLVNGTLVAEARLAEGELDGLPGVQLGSGADVLVTAFTISDPDAKPRVEVGR